MTWEKSGEGTYNNVYRNDNLIFKVAKYANGVDAAERAVRVWNEVNAHLQPSAYVAEIEIDGQIYHGWVCPFVEGVQATDEEISDALVEMYERNGRVVVDAIAPRNFIKTPEGQVICVDIGMALQLEQHETADLNQLRRRPSLDSLAVWSAAREFEFHQYNTRLDPIYPRTVHTMKALLFIKKYRPDIDQLGVLFNQRVLDLAEAYDQDQLSGKTNIDLHLLLAQEYPVDIEHTKARCKKVLESYMQFDYSNILADPKKQAGLNLLQAIAAATSITEIVAAFQTEDFDVLVSSDKVTSVNIDKQMQTQSSIDIIDAENTTNIRFDSKSVLNELNQLEFESDDEEHDATTSSDVSEKETTIVNRHLLDVLWTLKLECFNILTKQITKQSSAYYKKQLTHDKWQDQVTTLIAYINGAVSLEDIDRCLVDFETKHPITASSDLDQIRFNNNLCRCKMIVGSAMMTEQLRPSASFDL